MDLGEIIWTVIWCVTDGIYAIKNSLYAWLGAPSPL